MKHFKCQLETGKLWRLITYFDISVAYRYMGEEDSSDDEDGMGEEEVDEEDEEEDSKPPTKMRKKEEIVATKGSPSKRGGKK